VLRLVAAMTPSEKMIKKLDAAEKKADFIIEDARRNRKALLVKAREAATAELQAFAAAQDALYKDAVALNQDDHAARDLQAATKAELSAVESDFEMNKGKTVAYVVGKVLDVPLALTSTQRQALIAEGFAARGLPLELTEAVTATHKNTQSFEVFTPHGRRESVRTFDMATPSVGNRKSTRDSVSVVDSWIGQEGASFNVSPRNSRVGTSFSMGPVGASFSAIVEEAAIAEDIAEDEATVEAAAKPDIVPAEEAAAEPAAPSADEPSAEPAAEAPVKPATKVAATAKRAKKKGTKADIA